MDDSGKTAPLSLLRLLHPGGFGATMRVVGSSHDLPLALEPAESGVTGGDCIAIVPTVAECNTPGWLDIALRQLADDLAQDGVGYVVVPRRRRRKIRTFIKQNPLTVETTMLHLGNSASGLYILPTCAVQMRWVLSTLMPVTTIQRAINMFLRLPAADKLVRCVAPSQGLVVRRVGATPTFTWLTTAWSKEFVTVGVVMHSRRNGNRSSAIMHCFGQGDVQPAISVKTDLTHVPESRRLNEIQNLQLLGPAARLGGARVPYGKIVTIGEGRTALVQNTLRGQTVGRHLSLQADQFEHIVGLIVTWLKQWNARTFFSRPFTEYDAEVRILKPALSLCTVIKGGSNYVQWLTARCGDAVGALFPFVAAHNDLTSWNIVIEADDSLGVVDWESAESQGLALTDFYYALVDAALSASGHRNRVDAFLNCFTPGGTHTPIAKQLELALRQVVTVPDDLAVLCFHACWLYHAVGEGRKWEEDHTRKRPFLEIVRWLALNPEGAYPRLDDHT